MKNIFFNWIVPIAHLFIIVFLFISPWLIPWQYILILFILFGLQLIIIKCCILSQLQFGNKTEGYYYHYLKKILPKISQKKVNFVVKYIIPLVVIFTAYVVQTK